MTPLHVGGATIEPGPPRPEGGLAELDGETFYRISNHDSMPPFLMSLVSDSDLWMFASSNGALTAGRRDPDHAIFPYQTDDRIHDSQDQVGGKTLLRLRRGGHLALWEPFSNRYEGLYRLTRNLAKSVYGNKLRFEEVNRDLGMSISATWMMSGRFGFVRRVALANLSRDPIDVELLDGVQNVLPDGLTRQFQLEFSTLADGYKENELEPATGLALFRLSAIPTDRNQPNESLRATTVWSEGIEVSRRLLCSEQTDRFRRGRDVEQEVLVRGRRGAYFITARLALPGEGRQEWSIVTDIGRDAADVAALVQFLRSRTDPRIELDQDVGRGTRNLVRLVAGADGLQHTADQLSSWRHYSNALFNVMRGGVPDHGYAIDGPDFRSFVAAASAPVHDRQSEFLASLPATVSHRQLLQMTAQREDLDLQRLANEYLPLTFSRRHGDPSRPWNIFSIEVQAPDGRRHLQYQGNWRDIFQNWEALALSFPGYVEGMIFKFVDASTADGNNPYRITRDGFEWEVVDPATPWGHIGYWGDHQVVYLLRLLEASRRYHPGALAELLSRRLFVYADLPYRIKPYAEMLRDPFHTIEFGGELDLQIQRRAAAIGGDGKLLAGTDGIPYHANLAEKLLVVVLARLFNFIPEAGLWMNTQRPEWNDANNALVGNGVSVVTLAHLGRFLGFCRALVAESDTSRFDISAEVAEALRRVAATLAAHARLDGAVSDRERKAVLDALGTAGSAYRAAVYASGFSGERTAVGADELDSFFDLAIRHVSHSIRANRRPDGLYHSYNLMLRSPDGIAIGRLAEMLEGQVAVLGSGALSPDECADLLDALRGSRLYRPDQDSYLLYPDRTLPGFFARNSLPATAVATSAVLTQMIERDDRRIAVRDVNGAFHFNADLRNSGMLASALGRLELPEEETNRILALYEAVFDHRSFTGRSGTFYKYEGLGCIYWHMVSKLLVAVQEVLDRALADGEPAPTVERLRGHYEAIREGLGAHKSPDLHGAIPIDPYSHTPGFAGAQQPGMTGQVKEDLITRLGEMGVVVRTGRLGFREGLARRGEFLGRAGSFRFFDVDGRECRLDLEPGTLAFTLCQVPVVTHRSGPPRIEVTRREGPRRIVEDLTLDAATSSAIFERSGQVRRLDVFWGRDEG